MGSRILPIFLGCRPHRPELDAPVFALYQIGVAAWVVGAFPPAPESPALTVVRAAGALLIIITIVTYTFCLGLFARVMSISGCAIRSPQDGWQKYVFASWFWLLVNLTLGQGATLVRALNGGAESSLIFDFARHALAFGFAAQMVLGVASRVVPNFTGTPLWSGRARDVAFYLLNTSMAVRALEVPIGLGYWPQAWNLIAWSGPFGVLTMILFTVNILLTIRQTRPEQMPRHYRLHPTMKQGTASSIPETWLHYDSVAEARAGATRMYRDDRVLRVMLVTDGPCTFIEWIDR